MNDPKNLQESARPEEAYLQSHQQACDLLVQIEELLHDLPAPEDDENPINWAHVGTVNEVVRRLTAVVEFLSGTER